MKLSSHFRCSPSASPLVLRPLALSVSLALAALSASPRAWAQTAPDAGRSLQQLTPALPAPSEAPPPQVDAVPARTVSPGGDKVVVHEVVFSGNTVFDAPTLKAVLKPVLDDQARDLAGLQALAERIGAYYRAQGYPFARAYLPPQDLAEGQLRIAVVEGRYGQVQAEGVPGWVAAAKGYLAPLQPGAVIASASLERATLLLDDLPGVVVSPVVRPGQAAGTGDLDVALARGPRLRGEVGADNQGNRYSGTYRGHLNLDADSPFMLGDQISLRTLLTNEQLWLGSLAYSLPMGASGLRAMASYAHTHYTLGGEFASLDASGTARVASVGLSYPIVRTRQANLSVQIQWQRKGLRDQQDATGSRSDKSSHAVPLVALFDVRDGLGGGGLTYGSVAWTAGHLTLDARTGQTDASSGARTAGDFSRFNLELVRLQSLPGRFSLFGHFSGQWASKNLDSSEGVSLGGPQGVRAYPVGEASGDEAWLAQIELRYALGDVAPYVLLDGGQVRYKAKPYASGDNERKLSGAGVGVRWSHGAWSADASAAWRLGHSAPQSDTRDPRPRIWAALSYSF